MSVSSSIPSLPVGSSPQAQMKLKHAQQELKAKQTEVKKMDSGYQKDQEAFNTVKKNKEKLEADMGKLQYQGRGGGTRG